MRIGLMRVMPEPWNLESNMPGILIHDVDLSVGANEKMFDLRRTDIYEI